jgi:hypothetical protein
MSSCAISICATACEADTSGFFVAGIITSDGMVMMIGFVS